MVEYSISKEQRAKNKEQRTKSKEQRAKNKEQIYNYNSFKWMPRYNLILDVKV